MDSESSHPSPRSARIRPSVALTPGSRIGAYEIAAQIGVGGMGEVYRATDTNLKRQVAIKVLPAAVAADAERLARFQREAEVLAALNHPNIAHIHGLEKSEGQTALVMELVEGPTLADRIAEGPLPVDEALPIAKQIVEALEAAHEQGIVHRDLKPANIKLRPDGAVKVLDFGLAKAMEPTFAKATGGKPASAMSSGSSMAPTITTPAMTQAGLILGTAAYMAPEQARGRPVDRRADIWAFGCVLYEMLTGARAFPGEDVALTMAAVMTATPDFGSLPAALPPSLEPYLRRCLEKDPRQRVQAIGDLRLAFDGAFEEMGGRHAPEASSRRMDVVPWLVAVAAIVVATVTFFRGGGDTSTLEQPIRRLTIDLGDLVLPRGLGSQLAISRDGETLVFVADRDGGRQLYRRALVDFEARPIPGTAGALRPFLSPDGEWVAFVDGQPNDRIVRMPAAGGDSFTVCTGCEVGSWGDDGRIVFDDLSQAFAAVSERGGEPETLLTAMREQGVDSMMNPVLLSGGRAVLFEIGRFQFGGVGLASLDSGAVLVLTENGSDPFYSPTGHVLFGRSDTLFAMPVDLQQFQVRGPATPVLPGVRIENGGAIQAALSDTGVLVYAPADDQQGTELVWVDPEGGVESVLQSGRAFRAPRLSPDGRAVAVQIISGDASDIWVHEAGTLRPLTTSGNASEPLWTPDGRSVTFMARLDDSFAIQSVSLDSAEAPATIAVGDVPLAPEGWLPDGRLLLREGGTTGSLSLVEPAGGPERHPYLTSDASIEAATISPTGSWLAYVSNQTGTREVYVRPFPGPGREQLVSDRGGVGPSWGPTDGVLFYLSTSGETTFRATLGFEPLEVVARDALFTSNEFWSVTFRAHYDVHPEDGRLLMLRQRGGGSELRVVENWFAVLRERVGE